MDNTQLSKHPVEDLTLGTVYDDGEMIFQEGDHCDALYVVQSGKVRIVSLQSSGTDVEIAVAGPGEVFGITSLFDSTPRCASAVAVGRTSVLKLVRSRIIKAIHHDPSLVFFILKSMSLRARKLQSDLVRAEFRSRHDLSGFFKSEH